MPEADFDVYLITERHQCKGADLVAAVTDAVRGGVRAVQLRDKDLTTRERYELGRKLWTITREHDAKLFVNGDAALARAIEADGVHLPQDGLPADVCRRVLKPGMLIGVSTHTMDEALDAEARGADFITYGPVYYTPSKAKYGAPVGIDLLREVCAKVRLPVFALGGIKIGNLQEVVSAGAAGVSMISAILAAPDVASAASEFIGSMHDLLAAEQKRG